MTTNKLDIPGTDHQQWGLYGLDHALQSTEMEYRNQREDYGDCLCGDWFAVATTTGPDGQSWHVLFTGTFGNDHSPGASCYTSADLYDAHDVEANAEFARDLASWEAMPEYEETDDDDSENPDGWDSIDTSTD